MKYNFQGSCNIYIYIDMRAFVFFSRKLKGETENNCADLLILIYSAKTFKDSLEQFIVNGF